ncbi:unnamed protein product [Paramecium octaurelia]|uniref:Uncharacterized protein n=1 Tax=Paramecium octaurelia TaxID=43137 RepID=A0A8S1SJ20_PAROT|nr:unnamed protein product [Paramecium octaurelia]
MNIRNTKKRLSFTILISYLIQQIVNKFVQKIMLLQYNHLNVKILQKNQYCSKNDFKQKFGDNVLLFKTTLICFLTSWKSNISYYLIKKENQKRILLKKFYNSNMNFFIKLLNEVKKDKDISVFEEPQLKTLELLIQNKRIGQNKKYFIIDD